MASKKSKAAPARPGRKGPVPAVPSKARLWVPLLLLAAIAGVAAQIYLFTRKAVDMRKEFVYHGKVGLRGLDQGRVMGSYAMCTDRQGNFFNLDIEGNDIRVQKFTLEGKYLGKTQLKPDQLIMEGREIVTDSQGNVYVLERGKGSVVKLDKDLKFVARLRAETEKINGLTVNDKDEIVVIDYGRGGFLKLAPDGTSKGLVQSKDADLVSGWRIAAAPKGGYAVLFNMNQTLVVGTYSEGGSLENKWKVTQVTASPSSTLGLDAERRIYLNDAGSTNGVHAFTFGGKYLGGAKTAGPGLDFLNQGCLWVDRFTGRLFLNSPAGIDMVEFKWK